MFIVLLPSHSQWRPQIGNIPEDLSNLPEASTLILGVVAFRQQESAPQGSRPLSTSSHQDPNATNQTIPPENKTAPTIPSAMPSAVDCRIYLVVVASPDLLVCVGRSFRCPRAINSKPSPTKKPGINRGGPEAAAIKLPARPSGIHHVRASKFLRGSMLESQMNN